jgi:hypothetical protein
VQYAKLRALFCFNPVASRTVLQLRELRAMLGMGGKTPDEIAEGVQAAYAKGQLQFTGAINLIKNLQKQEAGKRSLATRYPRSQLKPRTCPFPHQSIKRRALVNLYSPNLQLCAQRALDAPASPTAWPSV